MTRKEIHGSDLGIGTGRISELVKSHREFL